MFGRLYPNAVLKILLGKDLIELHVSFHINVITKNLTYILDLCHLSNSIMAPQVDPFLRHACSSHFDISKQLIDICAPKLLKAFQVISEIRLMSLPSITSSWHSGHCFSGLKTKIDSLKFSLHQLTSLSHHLSEKLKNSDQLNILSFGCCGTLKLSRTTSHYY